MSSQTAMTQQSATPCNDEWCFTTTDGLVTAMVEWRRGDDGQVYVCGYSLNDESIAELPVGNNRGHEIGQLVHERRLINPYGLFLEKGHCLRVDDNRPGRNWSYVVWTGKERLPKSSFAPNAVYHWFDNEQESHDFPRLNSFEEVMELVHDPDAISITTLNGVPRREAITAPEVVSKLGKLDDGVVVWDRTSIARDARIAKG